MYLHGFPQPNIHEYDTLTSEERWDEYSNVILANPPFMSPKGGIRPHNRFSVQSGRSEVLFVDYIAEHLTPDGRAAVIVPEGIIFQSQNAHTQLRRMLIEEYLVAVVSLPPGVFNPYSAVKTSILVMDKSLARRANQIAFFKVAHDGYDLGAQRRPVTENDLPAALDDITEYLRRMKTGEPLEEFRPTTGLIVDMKRIAEDSEYNLSGERYRETGISSSEWPLVGIGQLAEVIAGQSPPGGSYNDKGIGVPFYQGKTEFGDFYIKKPSKWTTDPRRFAQKGDILMSVRAPVGQINVATQRICIGRGLAAIRPVDDGILPAFAFRMLRSMEAEIKGNMGATFASINKGEIEKIQVPFPPLEIQREIVAEIEGYQRVMDGARAVIENYRPHVAVDPEWPIVKLGKLAKPQYGFTAKAEKQGDARFIRITDIKEDGTLNSADEKYISITEDSQKALLARGDILVARTGATYGKTMMFAEDYSAVFASYLIRLRFSPDQIDPRYYWAFSQTDSYWTQAKSLVTGGGQPQFNGNVLKQVKVPVPSLDIQQSIISEIEAERAIVDANRELVKRMEARIAAAIGRVWETNSKA